MKRRKTKRKKREAVTSGEAVLVFTDTFRGGERGAAKNKLSFSLFSPPTPQPLPDWFCFSRLNIIIKVADDAVN